MNKCRRAARLDADPAPQSGTRSAPQAGLIRRQGKTVELKSA